jgi:hypothetical protein
MQQNPNSSSLSNSSNYNQGIPIYREMKKQNSNPPAESTLNKKSSSLTPTMTLASRDLSDNNSSRLKTDGTNPSIERIEEKWEELLEEIKKHNRMNLRAALSNVRFLNIDNNILTLTCDNEFQCDIIKSNKAFLHEREKTVFGCYFDMVPVVVARKEKILKEGTGSKHAESDHPIVQALLDEFEAEPLL